jgi:hypothetical protein
LRGADDEERSEAARLKREQSDAGGIAADAHSAQGALNDRGFDDVSSLAPAVRVDTGIAHSVRVGRLPNICDRAERARQLYPGVATDVSGRRHIGGFNGIAVVRIAAPLDEIEAALLVAKVDFGKIAPGRIRRLGNPDAAALAARDVDSDEAACFYGRYRLRRRPAQASKNNRYALHALARRDPPHFLLAKIAKYRKTRY